MHSSVILQCLVHLLPPPRRVPPQRPDADEARQHAEEGHSGKDPADAHGIDPGGRHNDAHAAEDVADKVVDGDARGALFADEFREHRGGGGLHGCEHWSLR